MRLLRWTAWKRKEQDAGNILLSLVEAYLLVLLGASLRQRTASDGLGLRAVSIVTKDTGSLRSHRAAGLLGVLSCHAVHLLS